MRVAVDSNVFVYALTGHESWGRESVALFNAMRLGKINGIASVVSFTEVTGQQQAPSDESSDSIQMFMEGLEGLAYFPVDLEVAIIAGRLRAGFGSKLHTPDSLHIATALRQGADVFVTNDNVLRKLRIPGLKIVGIAEPLPAGNS